MIKVCITGHRKLRNPKEVRENIRYNLQYFQSLYTDIEALTAMASGSDTIFAQEALDLGIPVKAIFPFESTEYEKDFSQEEWQSVQAVLKNELCELKIVHPHVGNSPEDRNAAYLATGKLLVDGANIVLAVWDRLPSKGKGGTADIVHYAKEKHKELHIIDGPRNTTEAKQATGDKLETAFNTLDTDAVKYKRRYFEPAWIGGILAGVLAAASFAIGLAFLSLSDDEKFFYAAGEVLFLGSSALLLLIYARKWKAKFISLRRTAEYLRTVLRYRATGIPVTGVIPAENISAELKAEIEKLNTSNFNQAGGLENARRLIWDFAREQAFYQQNTRIDRFKHYLEIIEKMLSTVKYLFLAVALFNFLTELQHHYHLSCLKWLAPARPWLILLWIVLPSIYAALEGVKYFTEWKMNIAISEKMKEELEAVMKRTLLCADEKELVAEAENLRHTLERENNNWLDNFKKKSPDLKP